MDAVLQIAARIFVCRRRSSTDDVSVTDNVSVDVCKQVFADSGHTISDDGSRSTDADSFDGSDTDTDDMDLVPNSEPSTAYNTDDEEDSDVETSRSRTSSAPRTAKASHWGQLPKAGRGTCLNPQAAPFVPLQHHTVATNPYATDQNQRLSSLLEVLSKLTPQDAAVLRVFVENKLAAQGDAELAAQAAAQHASHSVQFQPMSSQHGTCALPLGSSYCQQQVPTTCAGWDANPTWNCSTAQEWNMS